MTLTIDKIYDPVKPDPAQGIKGRASYKVMMTDGNAYYAGDEVGPKLNIGHSYDNLDISKDKYGNNWLNWRKGSFTPTKEPASTAPVKPEPAPQGRPNLTRDRSIILQTIIKACAAPNGDELQADAWLNWYSKRMRTGAVVPGAQDDGPEVPF